MLIFTSRRKNSTQQAFKGTSSSLHLNCASLAIDKNTPFLASAQGAFARGVVVRWFRARPQVSNRGHLIRSLYASHFQFHLSITPLARSYRQLSLSGN